MYGGKIVLQHEPTVRFFV